MNIQLILKEKFGHDQFRIGQEAVIQDVLAKKNTIAILPTGTGKSLCYQLPAYLIEGTVLIVSPLVALMEDQVAMMKRNGEKRVVALNSFLAYQEKMQMLCQLDAYKFVFISPEMLMQQIVANRLKQLKIAFVVVDEAHCISQWGFDFRPDYLRLGEYLTALGHPKVLALTATADDQVLTDITHYLQMDDVVIHKHSLDRPNITYEILQVESEQTKTKWLIERLKKTTGPGIIYVGARGRADSLARILSEKVGPTASYHAGMEQEDRAFIQEQFINGDIEWICATNAFGMGIHKDDIRQVIHEHIPSTIAGYTQEVGRAGRDGKPSAATLLYTATDISRTRFIIEEDMPTAEEIRYYSQLLTTKNSKEEAAQLANITETGQRVLAYYFERLTLEETIQQLVRQKVEKEAQYQKMLNMIQSNQCIRQVMLSFFGEVLFSHPEACCSNCGLSREKWLEYRGKRVEKREVDDWAERLSKLLG